MVAVFINELHYDNEGTDVGEAIEIAGPAGTDLSGWSIVLYNGNGGEAYTTTPLSSVIPDQDNGFGTIAVNYPVNGIQNGSPDGIALVDNSGTVVQFLSYEGTFTAVGGPANGITSIDIGVAETAATPLGFSLQLTGTGTEYADFTWAMPADDSFGAINVGQDFGGGDDNGSTPIVTIQATDSNAAEAGQDPGTFTISRTGDTTNPLTVAYTIATGTGQASSDDYSPTLPGTVTIPAGSASVEITITPIDDSAIEGSETVTLNLTDGTLYDLGSSSSATVTIADNDILLTPIYDIQGASHISPLNGQRVATQGVVTAIASNGFYLQDPTGDGDAATSDGIFVFAGSGFSPSFGVGASVQVTGTVTEFQAGAPTDRNLTVTQITSPTINVLSESLGSVTPLDLNPPTQFIDNDTFNGSSPGGVGANTPFDPQQDGIDYYESVEGMLVQVVEAQAVAPTNNFGEIWVVANSGDTATGVNSRGGITIRDGGQPNPIDENAFVDPLNQYNPQESGFNNPFDDFNPERIQLDDTLFSGGSPQVSVNAQLGNITGVVSYSFGNYEVLPISPISAAASNLTREVTDLVGTADQLTVASFNVENLDPSDDRFATLANLIVNNLKSPDILGLQEIQDNDGAVNSTVTSAAETLQKLADAIAAAGGPQYAFVDNPFIGDDTNGGEPGGNIRTAYLYRTDRVDFVEGSLATVTDPQNQQTDPSNPFFDSRLPLVATFTFNGEDITLINNHFTSKGGSTDLYDNLQPAINGGEATREAQAETVNRYVETLLSANGDAKIVVLGDFNEFQFYEPIEILEQNLRNLTETLPENERYTFNFQGNSQALDHILVSNGLAEAEYDVVHVNSEFVDQVSDHDPPVARFRIPKPEDLILNGGNGQDTLIGGRGNDTIAGGNGADTLFGGAGDDLLDGGSGMDQLFGESGDDVLIGGRGNDLLDGGAGIDIAQYEGVQNLYTFSGSASNFTVRGRGTGTDTLINVEFLRFTGDNSLVATADLF